MKAIWNGVVIAESDKTIVVENNHYFPIESVNNEFLVLSDLQTMCPWKGKANYFSLKIADTVNNNAAWYYPEPSDAAKHIKGMVAFWKGVEMKS